MRKAAGLPYISIALTYNSRIKMEPIRTSVPDEARRSGRAYWTFQLLFWCLLVVPDLFTISSRGWLDFTWSIGTLVLVFLVSHFSHRAALRRRWFYLSPGKMIVRLAGTVLTMATVYFATGLPEKFYRGPNIARFFMQLNVLIGYFLGSLFMAAAWMGCYMALSEWRVRRGLEIAQLRTKVAHQESQLENLKAQLKPHFLFNSLNTLRELMMEDTGQAQQMVTQLSTLLRYSLKSGTEMVLFSEELQAIEGYLAVERLRYEERLRVRWEVDAQARNAKIPPMLLQTLVENAVKHGIAARPEGGEVTVRAQKSNGRLCLEVLNTGEMKVNLSETGVGLRNARERLRLLYGEQARFVLENTSAGYVRAQVILPVEHR